MGEQYTTKLGLHKKTYISYYSILVLKNQPKKDKLLENQFLHATKVNTCKKTPVGVSPDGRAAYDRASAAAAFLPDLR